MKKLLLVMMTVLLFSKCEEKYTTETRYLVGVRDINSIRGSFSTFLGSGGGFIEPTRVIRYAYKSKDGGIKFDKICGSCGEEIDTTIYTTVSEPHVILFYKGDYYLDGYKKYLYSAKFYLPENSVVNDYILDLE